MLPRVKINFENGALGSVAPSEDGVIGLIATGYAVGEIFELDKPYLLTSYADLIKLNITSEVNDPNKLIDKCVREIYDEAPNGTKVWLMGVSNITSLTDMCDKNGIAKDLLIAARGAINILVIKCEADDTIATTAGIDTLLPDAINKAQSLAEWATTDLFAPCMVLLEGRGYTGNASQLDPLSERGDNRVAVVIGDSESDSKGAAVGLLAGRLAAIPVQRSCARVKDGAIASEKMYIAGVLAENGDPDIIHDAGYIVPRTFVGKAGYFWSDDKLATAETDDYALIPRRRVIDKAYRIAYQTLIDELNDEIPVTSEGKIPLTICKSIQDKVETAVVSTMGADGNLGSDPSDANDTGVVCYIDPDQNIVATSKYEVSLKVRPFGYAKYIDVKLGFQTTNG